MPGDWQPDTSTCLLTAVMSRGAVSDTPADNSSTSSWRHPPTTSVSHTACRATQGGCLDNAWRFLEQYGIPTEACHPYAKCSYPAFLNCTAPKGTMFSCTAGRGCVPDATGTQNATECEHSCKHKLTPIPKTDCGAPSGG